MKNTFKILVSSALILTAAGSCTDAQLKQISQSANEVGKVINTNAPLSNDEVVKGLREALTQGINKASSKASMVDGFLKNPLLKIPFPPEAENIETKLRAIGLGNLCDQFITSLNRGAEMAAAKSVPVFVTAITNMSLSDGFSILRGNKDAATQYLKTNTSTQLFSTFKPIIDGTLQQSNATKYWSDLITAYNKIPLVQKMNPDLSGFATNKAIDGLFKLVQEEELNIRTNATARTSDLLKRVFGQQ